MSARVLWGIIAGFLIGVLVRSFFEASWPLAAFFCALGAILFACIRIKRETAVLAIACIACAAGLQRMEAAHLAGNPVLDARIGETITIEGIVADEPDVRDSGVRLHLRSGGTGILVIAPPHAEGEYGNIVRVKGSLQLPETFDTALGRQFNYPMYLAKDGILYTLSFADVEVIGSVPRNPLKTAAMWVKAQYLGGLHRTLPEPESGLAGGITVGDKRGVGDTYSDIFITVGLIHIVVLSGYNISVVMGVLGNMLSRFPRLVQLCASLCIVAFIVLIAGGSASATRAGAMAIIPLVARMTGRVYLALRALGAVALVMVAWNPYILAFDPGFQLSILATLGLILFSPMFSAWLSFIPKKLQLREIAASTLGTQVAVLPLLLYQNGTLSIVALPANMFALVAVPAAMAFSVLAGVAGSLLGSIGTFVAFPAYVLLAYIIKVGELFAGISFAAVSIPAFSFWWVALAYAAMFMGHAFIKKHMRPDAAACV